MHKVHRNTATSETRRLPRRSRHAGRSASPDGLHLSIVVGIGVDAYTSGLVWTASAMFVHMNT
jgi:hypothetical protein